MALILKYNGNTEEIDVHSLTLETMQRIVDGYVEMVHIGEGRLLLVNEDARVMGLPFNLSASSLAHTTILGDTIFLTKEEVDMEKELISLKEDLSGKPKGDCKTCLSVDECAGWWRRDVEQNGATCCKRAISEKEARRAMHFAQA